MQEKYFGNKPRLSYLIYPHTTISKKELVEMDRPELLKQIMARMDKQDQP